MKIGIIGAGAMGGAMARGLLAQQAESLDIFVSNPSTPKLNALAGIGAQVTTDNKEVAVKSEIILLAIKPWLVEKVLKEIHEEIKGKHRILAVVAAGITISQIKQWTLLDAEERPQVILVMPNTAMDVAESMTFLVPDLEASSQSVEKVSEIFNYLGSTMVIDEAHLPGATALASCGIAYALRYVRASVEGGVELGFKADLAQQIVAQTIKGAAKLLSREGAHAETEIDKVTTPGGITIKGLNAMERNGFTNAVISGLKACVSQDR